LHRSPHARKVVDELADAADLAQAEQPPLARERVVRAAPRLETDPALLGKEVGQLLRLNVLVVGVGARRDESEDVLGERDGEEASERGARDGREEEMAAGLQVRARRQLE